jgi:ABC-type antimicrobial peptide transport system permease subunit
LISISSAGFKSCYIKNHKGDERWRNAIPVSTPWELNLTPSFAKDAATAVKTLRLPISFSAGLTTAALALSVFTGGLASYFMGRRMSKMKPADILRKL